jgi:ParB-like chromosome segregation protein Spo0J
VTPEEEEINRQPAVRVDIASLALSGSPRLAGANPEHVEAMAAAQGELPPIVVHRPTMRVIDGAHRVQAAIRRGEQTIAARFFDGPETEAFVLSVWLNVAHGLPLSLSDRKRAAERIALSHPQWSDRRVAAVTGISPGTVADIRRRVPGTSQPGASRVGQDGRVRPLDCSAGRRLAGQLMTENPSLSLRQVARAAAISPETARDVRNRLLSGADLIPARSQRGAAGGAPQPEVRPSAAPPARLDVSGREYRPLGLVRNTGRPQPPVPDRATVVNRLKGDPALRYTETGRNLLRMLSLHTQWTQEWDAVVTNLPPHCTDVVADLAREFADLWSDFANRAGRSVAAAG